MADFEFNALTHSPERLNVISTKLGTGGADLWTDSEIGKAVKLGSAANHVPCVDGDEIEGFVDNIDAGPTSGGHTFGGVARGNRGVRVKAQIGASQGANATLGALVVADDQVAVGTKGLAQVRTGTPAVNKWRILSLRGTGAAGTEVILELC